MSDEIILAPTTQLQIIPSSLTIASPEVAANKPLADLVNSALTACSKSQHTRRSYTTGIGMFLQFLEEEHRSHLPVEWLPLAENRMDGKKTVWAFSRCPSAVLRIVDASLLDTYAAYRQEMDDSQNTIIGRVAAARTLLAVALRDRILSFEQAQMLSIQPYKTRRSRDEDVTGRRLTPAEVRAMRATFNMERKIEVRDLAIVDVMLFSGLRRSEVAALKFSNLIRDSGRWWVRIQGKRKKTRRIKMHDSLYASLSRWFEVAGLKWRESDSLNAPVFRAFDKGDHITIRPIDTNVIDRVVSGTGARTSVIGADGKIETLAPITGGDRLSSHDLRRTFARNAYDNGAPLVQVQLALGHDDPKTTIRYIGLDLPEDRTAVDFVRY